MRTNQQVKPVVAEDYSTVTFEVLGHPPIVLDMGKLHPDVLARAACAGMAQVRIVDAAALSRARADGSIIPQGEFLTAKYQAMKELVDHYMTGTGEWSKARAGGETRQSGITILAIAKVQSITVEEAEAKVAELANRRGVDKRAMLAQLAKSAKVAEAILAIKAASVKSTVDGDALLDELTA